LEGVVDSGDGIVCKGTPGKGETPDPDGGALSCSLDAADDIPVMLSAARATPSSVGASMISFRFSICCKIFCRDEATTKRERERERKKEENEKKRKKRGKRKVSIPN
jgi:hypothetical protein